MKALLLIALMSLSIGLAHARIGYAEDILDRTKQFEIESGALDAALVKFSEQAQVAVSADGEMLRRHRTAGIQGEQSARTALTQLLANSPFTFKVSSDIVQIARLEQGAAAAIPLAQASAAPQTQPPRPPTSSPLGGSEANSTSRSRLIDEVIVTAQKREERIIDVPMSITAISGDRLGETGINNTLALASAVPSLAVTETGPGRQIIIIRGIHSLRGSSSLTGMYLDEMPVSGAQDGFVPSYADLRVIDLERVEVLKGPQGTLFGEGAAGGVIRFISRDPDLSGIGGEIGTSIYSTNDGGWSKEFTGVLNAPLAEDKFGIRIAATYEDAAGWIDQPSIGREDINDSELKHVRAKALWAPMPELQVKGTIEVHRNEGGGSNIINQTPYDESIFLQAFDRSAPTNYEDNYDLYNLAATYDLGGAELLSSTSYAEFDSEQSFPQLVGQAPTPWYEVLLRNYGQEASIASQEFRLTSQTEGSSNWTIGAQYKDAEITQEFGPGADARLLGGLLALSGINAGTRPTNSSESWALFADGSYEFGRLEIGGGLRYFNDEREAFDPSLPNIPVVSRSFDKVTYRAFARFQATDGLNVYVNAGTGFRSGGFNAPSTIPRGAPAAYGTEEIISYEAGMKMSMLDGRVRFSAALFHSEYQDMVEDIASVSPVDGRPLQYTMNGQDAEVKGIEWDIYWALTNQVAVTLAGDVIDSEITEVDPANLQPRYFVGDHISLVPEYQLSASVDYRFEWFGSAPGSFLLSFNRQGKSHFYNRNFALLLEDEAVALEKNFLNANLGGEWNGWELSVFGRNLLDEDEILNANTNGWTAQARPRTFGFGVKKTF